MPLFTYICESCRKSSELLVRSSDTPPCPHCGKQTLVKQASAILPKMGPTRTTGALPPSCESCASRGSCPNL
ncbi:MAG: zinc ribbon domain-containing protein [Candidatus Hydrogenedentes bacterium]|nr:zinc ribbon domain-containing protein [Candidatus Hydrogenedentota bacterium]